MLYFVQCDSGDEVIDANCEFDAAGEFAAKHAISGNDEPCMEPFDFTVNGQEYSAKLLVITSLGTGVIAVSTDDESRFFNEHGNEVQD